MLTPIASLFLSLIFAYSAPLWASPSNASGDWRLSLVTGWTYAPPAGNAKKHDKLAHVVSGVPSESYNSATLHLSQSESGVVTGTLIWNSRHSGDTVPPPSGKVEGSYTSEGLILNLNWPGNKPGTQCKGQVKLGQDLRGTFHEKMNKLPGSTCYGVDSEIYAEHEIDTSQLKARGFTNCRADENKRPVCDVPLRYTLSSAQIALRNKNLSEYAGYEGNEVEIGKFTVTRISGEGGSDAGYLVNPEVGAKLRIYESPDLKSKVIEEVKSDSTEKKRIILDTEFYQIKNGFLKMSYRLNEKNYLISHDGWVYSGDVDNVSPLSEAGKDVNQINPSVVGTLYDAPNGAKVSFGKYDPNLQYQLNITQAKLVAGKIWLEIGYSESNPCGDGMGETPKQWVGKWIILAPNATVNYSPC